METQKSKDFSVKSSSKWILNKEECVQRPWSRRGQVCVCNEKTGVAAGLWAGEWGKWERLWPALQYLMLRLVDRLNIKNELDSAYSE